MRTFPSKSPTIARNSSSCLFKYILDEANIIVSDDYTQYITMIKLMAELQNVQILASNPTRDNHILTSKTDIVSIFHRTAITSIEFQSLVENQWISHEIVDLLSKIFQQENKKIHVYTSHFMSQYMMQADHLKTFHQLIPNEVDFLYIPINHEGNQWLLCRLDFSKKVILLLNSLSNDDVNRQYLTSLQKYVSYVEKSIQGMKTTRNKSRNADKWKGNWTYKDDSMNSPQQSNTNDSGIFTILNMCLLISGVKVTQMTYSHTKIINRNTRERLAKIIFDFTDWEKLHNTCIEQEKTSELDSSWQDFVNVMFYQCYYGSNFKEVRQLFF
jgi:hypothetical protein